MTAATPDRLLTAALARDGARPLLTFHDAATGERTELSVTTFANWVAKTANLLLDEVGVGPGDRVAIRLPAHWQSAVWLQAAWTVGLQVDLEDRDADLHVVTHDVDPGGSGQVVSLGLAPMGLPVPGATPTAADALDYDRSVHAYGDQLPPPVPIPGPALTTTDGDLDAGRLVELAAAWPTPPGALLVTEEPRRAETVLASTLVPLATGVTTVLLRHADPDRLDHLVRQEGIRAVVGPVPGNLPAWPPVPGEDTREMP